MKVIEYPRLWQPNEFRVWHIKLPTIGQVDAKWLKGRQCAQIANFL